MIGCKLFRDIFTQVRPDATLIFVGDKDQLQSIEPGQVFTDMIDSKVIPTTILDHIFRQGQNSMIPINAKLINEDSSTITTSSLTKRFATNSSSKKYPSLL